jgi:type II secretory ATPase GspE/PulE/Tfp pilus assembly ATPase PilB-like protein/ActR/RegA family two-component response regulator
MAGVVRRAGLIHHEDLSFTPGSSLDEVWSSTAQACGVDTDELARTVASAFSMTVADLDSAVPSAMSLLPVSIARKFGVFALQDQDRFLSVATSNPIDPNAEQEIGFASGRLTQFAIAPPSRIQKAIDTSYEDDGGAASMLSRIDQQFREVAEVTVVTDEESPEVVSQEETAAGPIVKLMNIVLNEAVARGASDVHLQPMAGHGVVRFRTDGVLHNGMQVPLPVMTRIVSRIKIMARLDITDRLRPQDGKAKVVVAGKKYDLRVSTVPTRQAEKAVIRVLDTEGSGTLEDTGITPDQLALIRTTLSHRDGVFIVTGPTGSGKTTTMYGALREIATEDVNIMTVEDPVEYELPDLTQIQVEHKQGMSFSSALRAILRQDPDVIFVGEIRDGDTAEVAAQASLTGHLVLATLHTNDAVGSIRRFLDLGLAPGTVGETLRGALAQRLIRKVCEHCVEPVGDELTPEEQELADLYGHRPVVRTVGCDQCMDQGYLGRLPVTEFMVSTPALVQLMLDGTSPHELQRQAVSAGMVPLLDAALARVDVGETTLQEVERVVGLPEAQEGEAEAPVTAAPVTEVPAAISPATSNGAKDHADGEGSEIPHVLLVDDDGTTRNIARALIEAHLGYKVSESPDGSDALLRLARGEVFSLMILDLDMPILGGREVLRSLRQSIATVGLPVIVLTGTPDPNAEIELMEMGADDYIRKPIDPKRLQTRVKATLRRAGLS